MSRTTATRARPLSPHLQVYRLIPTMLMSIIHRITGCALYFGTLLVAIWVIALASSAEAFGRVSAIYGSWIGIIVLFGYTWVLMHHLVGGIRHLVWDTGTGLGKETSTKVALASPFISAGLTLAIWIGVFVSRGGGA